ncbi:hypothetical protein Peur_019863 [Populus x canadensis]
MLSNLQRVDTGHIPKLVEFLKYKRLNTSATLKCLYYLAKHTDNHKVRKASTLTVFRFNFDLLSIFVNSCYVELKEAIVRAGAVRRIVKLICRGDKGPDAMAVLLRLSKTEALREEIGKTKIAFFFWFLRSIMTTQTSRRKPNAC